MQVKTQLGKRNWERVFRGDEDAVTGGYTFFRTVLNEQDLFSFAEVGDTYTGNTLRGDYRLFAAQDEEHKEVFEMFYEAKRKIVGSVFYRPYKEGKYAAEVAFVRVPETGVYTSYESLGKGIKSVLDTSLPSSIFGLFRAFVGVETEPKQEEIWRRWKPRFLDEGLGEKIRQRVVEVFYPYLFIKMTKAIDEEERKEWNAFLGKMFPVAHPVMTIRGVDEFTHSLCYAHLEAATGPGGMKWVFTRQFLLLCPAWLLRQWSGTLKGRYGHFDNYNQVEIIDYGLGERLGGSNLSLFANSRKVGLRESGGVSSLYTARLDDYNLGVLEVKRDIVPMTSTGKQSFYITSHFRPAPIHLANALQRGDDVPTPYLRLQELLEEFRKCTE